MFLVDEVLTCAAEAAPDRVAATVGNDWRTFSQLRYQANRLANALQGLGVSSADRVAYWSDLTIDAPAVQFALGRLGSVFAPLNPAYSDSEASAALEYLDPRLLVVDPVHAERGEVMAKGLGLPLAVLGAPGPGAPLDDLASRASDTGPSVPLPREEDVFAIFLTSGSTGNPKGVMISQRATWLRSYSGSEAAATTGGGGHVVTFPLFHMAGWIFAYLAWAAHQAAHFVTSADGGAVLSAVDRHRAASLYCIPAVWRRVLAETGAFDVRSMKWAFTGTSKVEVSLLQEIKERFPVTSTTINYGSTEVYRALSLADRDLFRKPGSVGLPAPGVRVRIADEGELLIRSNLLMSGYFRLPDETAAAMRDGWFHSGDLVEQDDEGYFCIVGRKKEMIRSGGEWVAPVEVETAIRGYPGVVEVAIFGVPDPQWGEVVCAAVVMAAGIGTPTVEQIRRHLTGLLAPYKHPRRVMLAKEIPRTSATCQVQRSLLATRSLAEQASRTRKRNAI